MKNELGFEVTDWIPVSTPPVRKGVYQIGNKNGGLGVEPWWFSYAYWDGKTFLGIADHPEEVEESFGQANSTLNQLNNYYRGVTSCVTKKGNA